MKTEKQTALLGNMMLDVTSCFMLIDTTVIRTINTSTVLQAEKYTLLLVFIL
jgi:hypothetical protein